MPRAAVPTFIGTHRRRAALLACLVLGAPGVFAQGPAAPPQAAGTATQADLAAAALACVALTNAYRQQAGRPPLVRDPALEAFAHDAATYDARGRKAHAWFRKTRGGGVSRAENQVPAWSLERYGTALEVVRQGLALMWNEGPRGPHRKALADKRYTRIGCAVVVDEGRVTVVQEFR